MKKALHQYCLELLGKRLKLSEQDLADAKESFQSETKSSVGDKHETSREMAREELRKLELNHSQLLNMKRELEQFNPNNKSAVLGKGSFVKTNIGNFYIACSIGKISYGTKEYFVMSENAPMAQALKGAKQGDQCQFQGQRITIIDLE